MFCFMRSRPRSSSRVEEVAALAAFLAGDAAASITGAILPIEGGWTA
jgi:3-hydroxybutyrate dehydrogenase